MPSRILVVDDEPYIRDLIRDTLRTRGYATDTASNGVEALEIAKREAYQIVVTDVKMPGMDGLEFLKLLKRAHPQVRVIVLTGYPRQSDIGDFLLQGADEFLPKPFRGNDLLTVIRRTEERIAAGTTTPARPGLPGGGTAPAGSP